jgi:gluconolactonase
VADASFLFAPPPAVATEVFARLPDRFRNMRPRPWTDANKAGRPVDCFLEGPSFDRGGNLYVVDIPYGRVFRIDPAGEWTLVTEYDGEPNGLKIHRDGRIFLADYRNGIMLLDPATGAVTPVVERRWSERFRGVNDLFFASNGDLYFTDQGQSGLHDPSGRVYRWTAAGRLELLLGGIPSPNGLVMNKSETVLYVAVTRANAVWRLPLMPDGTTSKVGLFLQLSGSLGGPDGLVLDETGGLGVCHSGLGSVWLFDHAGEPAARVRSCAGLFTTNAAFGGPDGHDLFITESETGTILRARMPHRGKAMFSHT